MARRKKTQARWRAKNPEYFTARRMEARGSGERAPEPLRLPTPLAGLPWDIAQDEFGVKGADFLGKMGKVLLNAAQDEMGAYLVESRGDSGTHGQPAAQDEIKGYLVDRVGVSATHDESAVQDEMRLGP
jgi:hypothetical protein